MHSKLRALIAFSGQATIIIAITLLLCEASLHLYNYFYPLPIFYTDSYNRWRPQFDYKLNSRGFNDVEHEARKSPGTFRILGIGDSFAFGVVPYRVNYLKLLEDDLNRARPPVEVINMGDSGHRP
jgi:hypothetical protein